MKGGDGTGLSLFLQSARSLSLLLGSLLGLPRSAGRGCLGGHHRVSVVFSTRSRARKKKGSSLGFVCGGRW